MLERVVVGDDDLGTPDLGQHLRRNEFTRLIVIVRRARNQHPQPILDRDARGHDEEGPREVLRVPPRSINRLPGDEHRHDGRLAAARGHLQGKTEQLRIGLLVGLGNLVEKAPRRRPLGRDLGQPDDRLYRFELAEERARAGPFFLRPTPMLEKTLRDAGHTPVGRIAQITPRANVLADLVDQRVLGVRLKVKARRLGGRLFPRGRDRHNEARWPTPLPRLSSDGLSILVEWMMQFRRAIGRVQNRTLVEPAHSQPRSATTLRSPWHDMTGAACLSSTYRRALQVQG
jgi:hypothetical protein